MFVSVPNATSSSEKLIEARQDEVLPSLPEKVPSSPEKVEGPFDSDGLELPPAGLLMSQESYVADDPPPPPPPPPPKSKAMPKALSNDPGPGKPPARLAPKPKIKSDDPASEAAASSDSGR